MKLSQKFIPGYLFILLFVLISGKDLNAQLIKSIEIFSDYSQALNRYGSPKQYISTDLKVSDADAVGGGVKVNFNLYKIYYIGVSYGYQLYSVHQESSLEKWNWLFWDTRYKGNVKDALASDPSLSGILTPIQKLDLMPLLITINAEYKPVKGLSIDPSLGFGVAMYTRRLYLEESWKRKFDALNYTFGYTFQNFAPNKTGNPLALCAGVKAAYEFMDGYRIHAEAGYVHFLKTPGKAGSDDFPLERIINIKLGLTFLY